MFKLILIFGPEFTYEGMREAILQKGGYFVPCAQLDRGVVTKEEAAIYVDFVPNLDEYEEEELRVIRQRLGFEPAVGVSIHMGHGRGSKGLIRALMKYLLARWPGFIDDNHTPIR